MSNIFSGDVSCDERGEVYFCNDFNFYGIKRFYILKNHNKNFVRAWHGHKQESKFITLVQGAAKISYVKIDNWENPSKNLKPQSVILTAKKPKILHIDKGYVNGSQTLTDDAKILIFSDKTLDESKKDDFRFPFDYWNCWEITQK